MSDEITTPRVGEEPNEEARLRQALEEKTREAEVNYDRYLRAVAELDNAKKRAQREREDYIRYANASLLRDLLPILDNFDRAVRAARTAGETPGLLAGVELIQRELLKTLEKFGVTPYTAVGQPFDPEKHEAVIRMETTEHSEMTVVEETLPGYLLNGRVFRPAMVTVAVPPKEPSSTEPDAEESSS
jgi:molecular chaperone GrpE